MVPDRKQLLKRFSSLEQERASYDSHWKELAEFIIPRSSRFSESDRAKGGKKNGSIYDNTGTRAMRILAAGMMSGMTSPARPWFRLTTSSPELDESSAVKIWLSECTRILQMIFAKSNTYRALHSMYEELAVFGTACSIVLPDYETVIHHYPLTIGEYFLAANHKGVVDTLYRRFEMTVAQVVSEFGIENCSEKVKTQYKEGNLDNVVSVYHIIEPRKYRDLSKKDNKNMAWMSLYFEQGEDKNILRESGFKRFPALCPRWQVNSGDVYGSSSPGMDCLGDIKQLQHEQLRKAQGIDYKTKPPLQAPTSLKDQDYNMLPGGVTYVDTASPQGGIRQAFEVNLDLSHLLNDIYDVRERIEAGFYADLFLMLANSDKSQMTATEVAERHEEKMLMLGPVIERMQNEICESLIDITFDQMIESGIVPPPPEELQGKDLNVEFVSVLAQAQKAVGTNSIDRFLMRIGQAAQFDPSVADRIDTDKLVDEYGEALGVNPEIIRSVEAANEIRQQRAQAQQAQQQAAMMQQGADIAQKLGSVDTSQQSALTDVMSGTQGYT